MRVAARLPLAVVCWIGPAAMTLPAGSGLRIAAVTLAVLTVPGAAVVLRMAPERAAAGPDPVGRRTRGLVLTVAVSLAYAVLAGQVLLLLGRFAPERALMAAAALGTVVALWPRRHDTAAPSGQEARSGQGARP
ncbi:hypothetical protein K7472_26125 [Streptomyces sp. PTM05]|uniref:Integral membrane protein n=1 Tax=Streptantibioticus parmotrematis TaxID=2873249 RepID=A0ABS7R048_9ACTN|nr:hypothetical protein [Streptantibioticus parmotrematis]MBY8888289.1 hypothetical protein [Streptantibioticus parmotrematis]